MNTSASSVETILAQAVEIATPAERQAFVEQACAGDAALKQQVERMIANHFRAGSFLEQPAAALGTAPMAEAPGAVIGPYKLLEQIGEGGMGLVYVAEQERPVRRRVALKIIKPGMDSRQVIARFEAERQALAMMDHPHIAKIHDGGTTPEGRPYFVMELVKGTPITSYFDQHRLPTRQRLQLFLDVCQAVQHAHQKGIIHRDLKPSNVLVSHHDVTPVVKVIDFGIAKATSGQLTDKTIYTQFAQLVGSPLYMSPEQAGLSDMDVDTRSDVYSLGVLLYELLTGTTPFDSETLKKAGYDELRRIIREDEPPRPSARLSTLEQAHLSTVAEQRGLEPHRLSRHLRGELDWIVMQALEKDRNRRYETASAFAADVGRYLKDEAVLACPPSVGYRMGKFARRNKGRLAAAAVLALALLVAVGGLTSGIGWAVRDREARRTRLTAQVELILEDVDRLERDQKWLEAQAAVDRAEAVLAGGEADDGVRQRIGDARRDLAFVAKLERIRQIRAGTVNGRSNDRGAAQDYVQAFHDYGVNVEQVPAETAVAALSARPALVAPIAAALDDWGDARVNLGDDQQSLKPLVAVARGLDRDPFRDRLRAMWGQPITPESQAELRRLAESIDIKAQSPATILILARTLEHSPLEDAAVQVLRDGQYAYPDDFWLNFDLGNLLSQRNDYSGAARHFSSAVSLRPDSAMAHNNLGVDLEKQGRLDEALAEYRKAIELDPQCAPPYGNLGNVLCDQKKLDEAIPHLSKAIELDPNLAAAWNNRGAAYRGLGRLDQAFADVSKAIELDPKYVAAWSNRGDAYIELGKPDKAVADLSKAIELDPKFVEAWYTRGRAYSKLGQPDKALADYTKAIELDPKRANAWNNRGIVYMKLGQLDKAVDHFSKAIELKPDCLGAHKNLCLALLVKGSYADAIAAYRRLIGIKPDWDAPLISVADLLANCPEPQFRDPGEAVRLAKKAVEIAPGTRGINWGTLGVAHYRNGDCKAAVAALEKSMALSNGGDSGHWFWLAMAKWKLDEKAQAHKLYDKGVEWMEENAPRDEYLQRLRAEATELLGVKEKP